MENAWETIMQREVWSKMLRERNHFAKLGVEEMTLTYLPQGAESFLRS
jgi:hypothetical protein